MTRLNINTRHFTINDIYLSVWDQHCTRLNYLNGWVQNLDVCDNKPNKAEVAFFVSPNIDKHSMWYVQMCVRTCNKLDNDFV